MAEQQPGAELFPPLVRPTWMDPRYLLAACDWAPHIVTFVGAESRVILPNNPNRWAFGFGFVGVVGQVLKIWPTGANDQMGFTVSESFRDGWVTLFTVGPMVSVEWSGRYGAANTIQVFEVFNHI